MKTEWQLSAFEELSTNELYTILKLRQEVFVVEQQCIYQDCDGRDNIAHHLLGWHNRGELSELVAYLRIIYPENSGGAVSIGRVLTHPVYRKRGLAKEIMTRCLSSIDELYPKAAVGISAQQYLIRFYESFGFHVSSGGYEEDGIPHVAMIRNPLP